jgi:RNA polymerase sigma-70 factor (sigma-E family)
VESGADEVDDAALDRAEFASVGPITEPLPRIGTYEEVFIREYEPMVRLAVLLIDEIDVAEELVQEAFVKLHENWKRVDNPGGYVRAVVVNRCRNELRRRQRERRFRRRIEPPATVELGADEIMDAIAVLPPKRRAAVVLRYYGGLSEREIAETLAVRPGTVKSLLHRGLAELKTSLGVDLD